MTVYGAAAAKDRPGWFFGLTGPQTVGVLAGAFPIWLAMAGGRWLLTLALLPLWSMWALLICLPVRGQSALQWAGVLTCSLLGRTLGWSAFQSQAAAGDLDPAAPELHRTDLPGVLRGIEVHDGPPMAGRPLRPAIVQNLAARTWAATARIVHPGIGLSDEDERHRMANGLADLLEAAATGAEISLLALQVRTVPDDGTERSAWVRAHRRPDSDVSTRLHAELVEMTAGAAVRTESFVTLVLDEDAAARTSRGRGKGLTGRARALYGHMEELEARLLGSLGCTEVTWLDTGALAAAIRSGFEPGDAPVLVPVLARPTSPEAPAPAFVPPLALAGPAFATTALRSYRHGDWTSTTSTILLPRKGALMGALARALVPSEAGERRSLTVFYRPVNPQTAQRATGRAEMSAAMATEMRRKVGRIERAKDRRATSRLLETDDKLERGRAMVKVSSAISVTVPAHWDGPEFARRLESSIRLCGFTPLTLDGAHDAGFAAAAIPLGTGLPRLRK